MVCPNCFSTSLNGPYSAANVASRRPVALMECSHCQHVFDPYERFGSPRTTNAPTFAA